MSKNPEETGSDEPKGAPFNAAADRAWKIAQLAATLASAQDIREGGMPGMRMNPKIASTDLDPYFSAALKRAETLLGWAEGKWGEIQAFRLFEEGKVLTEEEILKTFSAHGWQGLSSKQPVMDLMAEIREKFEAELEEELTATTPQSKFVEKVNMKIDDLIADIHEGELLEYTSAFRGTLIGLARQKIEKMQRKLPDAVSSQIFESLATAGGNVSTETSDEAQRLIGQFFEELKTTFAEMIPELLPPYGVENLEASARKRGFFKWCFPEAAATRAKRLYRPYEIFRRCTSREWFLEKLCRDSGELRLSQMPWPSVNLLRETFHLFDVFYTTEIDRRFVG
ncbi:MAG TPA: hypothetical protein VF585_03385 [Chthoniobacterales bacterium]|jgi:hypothetical protein